ncbi:sensor histidine kinase [Pantoea ananatis]|jgi:signal transduction histidine kinase|uniref:histidine kinase n=2 Tax=Pantoea ananas TaxID=553 RepID=D4GEQ7_PANAM|nr:ATP-binding protein [Pantoea ananatis]ADD79163.1 BaeS [Pantoea ananatis LMG 20103]ASN18062.1 two-component sensor histidine kinase [Pantoea ananatis]ERM13381.1 BaeS [Pantoea ananatis BRT175]KNA26382.1 sensor histidine kinase [Pantoea ananatis]KNA26625.1 sensor histidine kinase [Pantoea ananatis]
MKPDSNDSMWRWICIRILILGLGGVILIAFCMWLRFALQILWVYYRMPAALWAEFSQLRLHPEQDPARFHQIVDQWWGVGFSDPSIASSDWITVAVLVAFIIPFFVVMGLRFALPLAKQFSQLAHAARDVARGKFSTSVGQVKGAPQELVRFTDDFNLMTQQLARYERELKASHVAIAHELRSPLTAAMGRLQGIVDGVFEPEPRQFSMIMKQLTQLSRLTDELHLLSLADAGQLSLNLSRFNLADLMRERASWLALQAEAEQVEIDVQSPTSLPYTGDAFRFGQVITILMENALRYAAEGKRISIDAHASDSAITLQFRDYGPGVDPQFLSVIFDRFTRADSSRARHSGGSGLGLSIAKAIVEAHGGAIRASLPPEGGLHIMITLPIIESLPAE